MQGSILIVSKNRKEELSRTLSILSDSIDLVNYEVLVFLDGCTDDSASLKKIFDWVQWFSVETSIGSSAARKELYLKAKGSVFIGLDDDAHPLQKNFLILINNLYLQYPNAGILAFEEIRGIFKSDEDALARSKPGINEYLCNEFIGCGFAIRKEVYESTNGFPDWIDIYGEESCLSIETIASGYDLIYTNRIKINHRVNTIERKNAGHNYFRFEKQLKNITYYYIVYYKYPFVKIFKLYYHNFFKYGLKNITFFKCFFKSAGVVLINIPNILKHRKPIDIKVLQKMKTLSGIKY